jgi:hypothetical protein
MYQILNNYKNDTGTVINISSTSGKYNNISDCNDRRKKDNNNTYNN